MRHLGSRCFVWSLALEGAGKLHRLRFVRLRPAFAYAKTALILCSITGYAMIVPRYTSLFAFI